MNDKDKIFEKFLEAYFEKVKKILPDSHRARQLNVGGLEAKAVYIFETKFLKEPFMNVFKKLEAKNAEPKKQLKWLNKIIKQNMKADKFRSSMVEENIDLKKQLEWSNKCFQDTERENEELKSRWEKLELKFKSESYYNGDRVLAVIKELSPVGSDGGFHYCDYCKKTFPTLEEHEKHYQLKHKPKSEKSPNPEWWSVGDGIVIKKPESGKFNWEERKEKA